MHYDLSIKYFEIPELSVLSSQNSFFSFFFWVKFSRLFFLPVDLVMIFI